MAFNFPDSPTAGQIFTDAASGAQYVYTNGVWMQSSAAQIKLTAQARNRICNPGMQISQELGLDTAASASNTYIADQWLLYYVTSGAPGAAIRKDTPPTHPEVSSWYFRFSSGATPDTSIVAADFAAVRQPIEGIKIVDFNWGTAQARPAVLRFMARSTVAGTFCVAFRNSPATHSFVKNCVIAANVWTQFVIPIPACTLGTWLIDNSLSAQLSFAVMAGSTFTGGVDNTWTAGSFIATPQISNWMSASTQFLEFTNVGLYLDPDATGAAPPWVMPDEAQELAACQRYFYDTRNGGGGHWLGQGNNYSATLCDIHVLLPVQMRGNPAGTCTGAWNIVSGGGGMVAGTPGAVVSQSLGVSSVRFTASGLIGGGATYCQTGDVNARCKLNARM